MLTVARVEEVGKWRQESYLGGGINRCRWLIRKEGQRRESQGLGLAVCLGEQADSGTSLEEIWVADGGFGQGGRCAIQRWASNWKLNI